MEQSSLTYRNDLRKQIKDSLGKVIYTYTTQIINASRIEKFNKHINFLQIFLSAVSASGCLSTIILDKIVLKIIAALCSMILIIISYYMMDRDFLISAKEHLNTANALWEVRENYISLLTDFPMLSDKEIVDKRNNLQNNCMKIYNSAPLTDEKSYKLAQAALKDKEYQFFTKEELNKMLPENLRE